MARIELNQNKFIEKLVSEDHIDSNDVQFWYQLLSCSFDFMRVQDPRLIEKSLEPYLVRLTLSNSVSLNIGSLLRVFLDRVSRIKSSSGQATNPYYVFQSFNALYLIKCICKSYIETSSEELLIKSLRAKIDEPKEIKIDPPAPPLAQQGQNDSPTPNVATNTSTSQISNGLSLEVNLPDSTTSMHPRENVPPISSVNLIPPDKSEDEKLEDPPTLQSPVAQQETLKKCEYVSGTAMLDQLISSLIAIIVDLPLVDSTYLLQVEAIDSLLVLLSVQMYSTTPSNQSIIYRHIMSKKSSIHALILSKTLLNNFVAQKPVPVETGSIIIGLASGIWKVLTLGYGSGQEDELADAMPLLARQSLLLLNVLVNHYNVEKNPYREAIISCQDSAFDLSGPVMALENVANDAMVTATTSKSAMMSNSIKINFRDLYETICKYLHNDQVALLLYLLLHSNKIFRPYILTIASEKLDKLLLPLLKILYSLIEKGSHHVYMVLIIFIILSEEQAFNKTIHEIIVRGVPWYKDRALNEVSLGSLTSLIIIRSIQYNTFRIKDKFLHTNLFATLANLSNHFRNLHPYVCQRLVELLERLSKRYLAMTKGNTPDIVEPLPGPDILRRDNILAKALATDHIKQRDVQDASSIELDLTDRVVTHDQTSNTSDAINIAIPEQQTLSQPLANQQSPPNEATAIGVENQTLGGQQSPGSNSTSDHVNISFDDSKQDLSLIEEVIRMILEVTNNTLTVQLANNSDLIYTLLYKRTVFSSLLSSHHSFYNMVINVERILTFFYNEIESYDRSLSVEEIKSLIASKSKNWNFNQDKDSDIRLLFHYVEDEQPEEFFIPYIWTRIYYSSGIPWNSKRIVLFNPDDL